MGNAEERAELFDRLFISLGEWILNSFSDESLGLSLKEMMVMELLGLRGSLKMSELAALLHLPPTTATSIVDRMVRRGLLLRHRVEDERRVVMVTLSPEGQSLLNQHRAEHLSWSRELLSALSEDEQEQLISIIRKIAFKASEKT